MSSLARVKGRLFGEWFPNTRPIIASTLIDGQHLVQEQHKRRDMR